MHCIQKCQRTTQGSKKFPLVTVSVIDVHFKSLSNVKCNVEVTGCTDIVCIHFAADENVSKGWIHLKDKHRCFKMNITRLLSSKSAQIQLIGEKLQPAGKQN